MILKIRYSPVLTGPILEMNRVQDQPKQQKCDLKYVYAYAYLSILGFE